jgi:hypothetical protein
VIRCYGLIVRRRHVKLCLLHVFQALLSEVVNSPDQLQIGAT